MDFFLNKRRTLVFMKYLHYVYPSQRLPKIIFLYTGLKVGIFCTNPVTELTTSRPFTILNPLVCLSHESAWVVIICFCVCLPNGQPPEGQDHSTWNTGPNKEFSEKKWGRHTREGSLRLFIQDSQCL